MKKILLLSIVVLCIQLLSNAQPPKVPANKGSQFGNPVAATALTDINSLPTAMATKETLPLDVKGVVTEVCSKEGCWIKVKTENGNMMVKMKDHAFTVPLALNGKEILINGVATKKTTSVEHLKHYAEDAGKSKAEIEAIKEPKKEITITANGITVLN